jgi:hypothetical protein
VNQELKQQKRVADALVRADLLLQEQTEADGNSEPWRGLERNEEKSGRTKSVQEIKTLARATEATSEHNTEELRSNRSEKKNAPLAMFSNAQNHDSTGTKTWTEIANHSSSRMKHDRQKPRTKISWKKIAQN